MKVYLSASLGVLFLFYVFLPRISPVLATPFQISVGEEEYVLGPTGLFDLLDLARIVNARTSSAINPYFGSEDVTGNNILDVTDLNTFLGQYTHL